MIAQSAGAVEYTDCISAVELELPPPDQRNVLDMT